jgi:hypothetical protein
MIPFTLDLCRAFVAVLMVGSGLHHVARNRSFRVVLNGHGVLPARWATPVGTVLPWMEIAVGALAIAALCRPGVAALGHLSGGTAILLGLAFLLSLQRLRRSAPGGATGCGCSPFEAPLTGWSLLPGVAVAVAGLLVMLLAGNAGAGWWGAESAALAWAWGFTLATLVALAPAALPLPRTTAVGGTVA